MTATMSAADGKADFAAAFAEGWAIGATDPERFFAHFARRMTDDAALIQPLAREGRGPAGLRQLFGPLFEVMPDLRGELVRWGPTEDGVIVELTLHSAASELRWTTLDVIELVDGRITSRRAYFDRLSLIGALLRRPRLLAKLLVHRLTR
jgi:ketosteroid isomerase-like protein